MDLIISFIFFTLTMLTCLIGNISIITALLIGLVFFFYCGHRRNYSYIQLLQMIKSGLGEAIIVVKVMFIIGFVTGIWRSSGTIAFFVYYGMKAITPHLFLIVAFLLTCLLSYALGTSFGVVATLGIIFISLARTGQVNETITAGVIMSGVYFGDRISPVSSSTTLVAEITHTDILNNVKNMLPYTWVPWLITFFIYFILSVKNPIQTIDRQFLSALETAFHLSWYTAMPAIIIIILPLLKVGILRSMELSIIAGIFVSYLIQHKSIPEILHTMIFGYTADGNLGTIMSGGGMMSMIEVVIIVSLSSTYSGIFSGTNMLAPIQKHIYKISQCIGSFPTMIMSSLLTNIVFCNQTISTMMCNDLNRNCYGNTATERIRKAIELEDSVILLSGLVPWSIAASVPLRFLQTNSQALLYAILLYAIPLWHLINTKKSRIANF